MDFKNYLLSLLDERGVQRYNNSCAQALDSLYKEREELAENLSFFKSFSTSSQDRDLLEQLYQDNKKEYHDYI